MRCCLHGNAAGVEQGRARIRPLWGSARCCLLGRLWAFEVDLIQMDQRSKESGLGHQQRKSEDRLAALGGTSEILRQNHQLRQRERAHY